MEQRMTPPVDALNCIPPAKRGFLLVTVLVITAVGVLFGAGALLLFRYQCQMRIDRQHELEKVYAVRSALNYIKGNADKIDDNGTSFRYYTKSERDLRLFVKPVKRIFPDLDNPEHLDIGNEGNKGRIFRLDGEHQYNGTLDYEYGVEREGGTDGGSDLLKDLINEDSEGLKGFGVANVTATNNVKWWINIGMRGTGGWLQSDYGRRYFFQPRQYVGGSYNEHTRDIVRLAIIRNVTNGGDPGRRHGWPLSREGERALVFQVRQNVGNKDAYAGMTFSEFCYTGGRCMIVTNNIFWSGQIPANMCYMGMQIAGDKVSLFYVNKAGEKGSQLSRGYVFSDTMQLTLDTYRYFAEGCTTDSDGKIIQAPELRAVFEVLATSDIRSNAGEDKSEKDFLTWFRVTPAYQFDVFLEHPAAQTNLATVAQRIVTEVSARTGNKYTVRTYDTHGTDNKGFRKDEKDFEESKRKKGH